MGSNENEPCCLASVLIVALESGANGVSGLFDSVQTARFTRSCAALCREDREV